MLEHVRSMEAGEFAIRARGSCIDVVAPEVRAVVSCRSAAAVLEDEVVHDDLAPWPSAVGGSLSRVSVTAYGNDAASWIVKPPSPGRFVVGDLVGDLTNDDRVDLQDAEALQQAALAGDLTARRSHGR